MSVCIVAQYPWQAVKELVGSEPPGAIICSDTRASSTSGYIFPILLAKQIGFSKNLITCYTSSHVDATVAAFNKVGSTRNIKKIGQALKQAHSKFGGTTALIATVWHKKNPTPKILEVMPPEYIPKPCFGIVGIGHIGILHRFKELMEEDPTRGLPIEPTPQIINGLSKFLGEPVHFRSRFPLMKAGARIGAMLSQAIEELNHFSVGLPIQLTTISKGKVEAWEGKIRRQPGKWDPITDNDKLVLPYRVPHQIPLNKLQIKVEHLLE